MYEEMVSVKTYGLKARDPDFILEREQHFTLLELGSKCIRSMDNIRHLLGYIPYS